MSYIGIFGAGNIDRSDSSSNLLELQRQAVVLLRNGIEMHGIKRQTGWEMGIEGKWRYELADPFHTTAEIGDHLKRHFGESVNIRFCMHDATLLAAYPAFERLRLFARYTPAAKFAGYFDPTRYSIMVCMGTSDSPFEFQTEGILLHEIQHLIQHEEKFARGGDSSIGMVRYIRLAGEVEARNVCARHLMTQEQRRETLRSDSQDVPDNEQIVVV